MTQILNQPLSELPYWESLPFDTFVKILDLKQQQSNQYKPKNEFDADPYSEETWLAQFGDKKEPDDQS